MDAQGVEILILAIACGFSTQAGVLSGTVADPQHRVISGAQVELTCGGEMVVTRTDSMGHFAFAQPEVRDSCMLHVKYPGFDQLRQTVGAGSHELHIQLSLAIVKEALNVPSHGFSGDPSQGLPVGSASLSRAELETISNNTPDLIRFAKLTAGAPPRPDHVYIDGLPAEVLPPAEAITQITVNADPFSAEYADGDDNHIEITTGNPDRKFRLHLGGGGLGLGGGNVLAPGLGSSSSWASPSVSGAIPHLPLTFSLQGSFSSTRSSQLIQAATLESVPGASSASSAPSGGSTYSGSVNLYYSIGQASHASFAYNQSRTEAWNSGVGGLSVPEAGTADSLGTREVRGSYEKTGENWVWRSGLVLDSTHSDISANSPAPSLEVPGYLQAGGSPIFDVRTSKSNWTWKTALQSNSQNRFWTLGATVSRTSDDYDEVPNPGGQFMFGGWDAYLTALSGGATGTRLVRRGHGTARYASTAAAPFLQAEVWRSKNSVIMAGARVDYQLGAGVAFSPRLSAVSLFHGLILRGAAESSSTIGRTPCLFGP